MCSRSGYWEDIERLGLDEFSAGTSSVNPASLYGPDGVPYAPWMVGKVSEGPSKLSKSPALVDVLGELWCDESSSGADVGVRGGAEGDGKTTEQREFEYAGRGQELSGSGMSCKLLGDEVRLGWNVGSESNSKVTSRRNPSRFSTFSPETLTWRATRRATLL